MVNHINLFKFLEQKRNTKTPLRYKLILSEPLTEEDLKTKNLNLEGSNINSLPDNLEVHGDLDISFTKIITLPRNLKVFGYLDVIGTKITTLPEDLYVEDCIYWNKELEKVPKHLSDKLNYWKTKNDD